MDEHQMNKQIRELAEQAGLGQERWNTTSQFEAFLEKFAELVVKECAKREEVDGCSEIAEKLDDNLYCLSPVKGYCDHVDILCTVNDTGNGYIAHFPSHASHTQDNYICMNYAEADYLLKLLTYIHKEKQ
jgi:hypothetical protein